MDAVGLLGIVQALVDARHVPELTKRLLQGIRTHGEVSVTACYTRDALGENLLAIDSDGIDTDALPCISVSELDNPLCYCMHTRKACLIDQPYGLFDVGSGFDALRKVLDEHSALLALPLFDGQGQAWGALVLSGDTKALHAWHGDRGWAAVKAAYQRLLGSLTRYPAPTELRTRVCGTEEARLHARRLIAHQFTGDSRIARQLRKELLQLAESKLSVLITGETGVGKDHAAWLIHQASIRHNKAFVPVNCASIPKDLIEVELFGCARGAYTGANEAREGLVAAADGGTLFLDEIGDMPLPLQGTLLRLLNEKKYRPVGAVDERVSDFRLLCATHQPLPRLVREGRFRQDLYFRLCQLSLRLPTLRSRREDLRALVATLIGENNRQHQRFVAGITDIAVQTLTRHAFPGNIRELRSLILAACERTPCGQPIELESLQVLMRQTIALDEERATAAPLHADTLEALWVTDDLPQALETFERLMIDARLQQHGGSRRRAAESLGMPKRTLARKCQKWNLESASHD